MGKNDLTPEQTKLAETITATLKDADARIRAAINAAAAAGVSANEIARRCDPKLTGARGYSRPVVLEILGAEDIRATALTALAGAGINAGDQYAEVDVEVWRDASRAVRMRLSRELGGRSITTRGNLSINALHALQGVGLGLCQDESTMDMWTVLSRGEAVEIYKL